MGLGVKSSFWNTWLLFKNPIRAFCRSTIDSRFPWPRISKAGFAVGRKVANRYATISPIGPNNATLYICNNAPLKHRNERRICSYWPGVQGDLGAVMPVSWRVFEINFSLAVLGTCVKRYWAAAAQNTRSDRFALTIAVGFCGWMRARSRHCALPSVLWSSFGLLMLLCYCIRPPRGVARLLIPLLFSEH